MGRSFCVQVDWLLVLGCNVHAPIVKTTMLEAHGMSFLTEGMLCRSYQYAAEAQHGGRRFSRVKIIFVKPSPQKLSQLGQLWAVHSIYGPEADDEFDETSVRCSFEQDVQGFKLQERTNQYGQKIYPCAASAEVRLYRSHDDMLSWILSLLLLYISTLNHRQLLFKSGGTRSNSPTQRIDKSNQFQASLCPYNSGGLIFRQSQSSPEGWQDFSYIYRHISYIYTHWNWKKRDWEKRKKKLRVCEPRLPCWKYFSWCDIWGIREEVLSSMQPQLAVHLGGVSVGFFRESEILIDNQRWTNSGNIPQDQSQLQVKIN